MIELHPVVIGAITVMASAIVHLYWCSKRCTERHEQTTKEIVNLKLALASCPNEDKCAYHGVDFTKTTFVPINSQRLPA